MKHKQSGNALIAALILILVLASAGGWVANIVKLASSDFDGPVTPRIVLRGVGVPVVPLGIVMGYL